MTKDVTKVEMLKGLWSSAIHFNLLKGAAGNDVLAELFRAYESVKNDLTDEQKADLVKDLIRFTLLHKGVKE